MAGNMGLIHPFVFNQFGTYGSYAQVGTGNRSASSYYSCCLIKHCSVPGRSRVAVLLVSCVSLSWRKKCGGGVWRGALRLTTAELWVLEFELFKLHCKLVQQQAAIMAAASAAGGGAYIGAAPMAIATQLPPSALNGIASPGVVPSAQGSLSLPSSLSPAPTPELPSSSPFLLSPLTI